MKKAIPISVGLVIMMIFVVQIGTSSAQGMHGGMMCFDQQVSIPDKLPKPESEEWISKLTDILAQEKLSEAQYQADAQKYQAHRPYRMVIPQEANHIAWITRLFTAYGLSPDVKALPVQDTTSLVEAYENAKQLELKLIPQYEWLIRNAPDNTSAQVLDVILLQTRMHYTMFDHALRMGPMRGRGMGHGMGRGGMM
jgi:hypothetical protein